MRPHGRASVSTRNPRAFAVCDRCSFLTNHHKLSWQFDFAGSGLINKMILVCQSCTDQPQEQLRSFALASDPVPIMNARVQDYASASTDYQTTTEPPTIDPTTGIPIPNGDRIVTQTGDFLVTQPVGRPTGLDPNAIMPLNGKSHFRIEVPVVSLSSNGTETITATCSSAHGLVENSQISVAGAANSRADGFYSVKIVTATVFSYVIALPLAAQALLGSETMILTANVGLPYGFQQIPQTGS